MNTTLSVDQLGGWGAQTNLSSNRAQGEGVPVLGAAAGNALRRQELVDLAAAPARPVQRLQLGPRRPLREVRQMHGVDGGGPSPPIGTMPDRHKFTINVLNK